MIPRSRDVAGSKKRAVDDDEAPAAVIPDRDETTKPGRTTTVEGRVSDDAAGDEGIDETSGR